MAKVTIDGHTIEVPDGTTILQAARMLVDKNPEVDAKVAPPTMCYYSKLKTSGGYCRTCIVKVTKGSEKILVQCLSLLRLAEQQLWMEWK